MTSLLIDAMWSAPDWCDKGRSTGADYANSIAQVIDLRRSLDVLLAQPDIDRNRISYVGHDFSAMYGAILAGVDTRPSWTKPADVQAYVAQMAPLDPVAFLSESKARAYYFQFSSHDRYITPEHELEFFGAASVEPDSIVNVFEFRLNQHDIAVGVVNTEYEDFTREARDSLRRKIHDGEDAFADEFIALVSSCDLRA